mmetsp:Transcript_6053/g.18606  ORF Transcript_6053/g.18606 Transcript_6053/m.18606 type:complete len:216 (-) Transcript_6053:729-1376(-)
MALGGPHDDHAAATSAGPHAAPRPTYRPAAADGRASGPTGRANASDGRTAAPDGWATDGLRVDAIARRFQRNRGAGTAASPGLRGSAAPRCRALLGRAGPPGASRELHLSARAALLPQIRVRFWTGRPRALLVRWRPYAPPPVHRAVFPNRRRPEYRHFATGVAALVVRAARRTGVSLGRRSIPLRLPCPCSTLAAVRLWSTAWTCGHVNLGPLQ